MSRLAPRSDRWLLGLALPAALVFGGCDSGQGKADKRVDGDLSMAAADDPNTPAGREKAQRDLDSATKETAASPTQLLRAKVLLAESEMARAGDLAARVAVNESAVTGVVHDLTRLTAAVADDNRLVAALGKGEPTAVLAKLQECSTAMTGSADKPDWVTTDGGAVSSQAAADKAAADLQQQVDALQQQIKTESDQRTDLLARSDKSLRASQQEDRAKSLDLFTESADSRKEAGDLGAKLDQDRVQLDHLQADLAVQQAQQAAVKAALAGMSDQTGKVNDAWTAVQEQVRAVKAHAAEVAGNPDVPVVGGATPASGGPWASQTVAGKAAAMAALLRDQRSLQAEADTHFNSAIRFYKDATDQAKAINATLGDAAHNERPERLSSAAFEVSKLSTDPAQYRYLQATAEFDRAEFFARAAADARAVAGVAADLKPVMDAAGLKVPDSLNDGNGDLLKVAKDDAKQADDTFKDATENFNLLREGSAPSGIKQGALLDQMFAQYGWSLLAGSNADAQASALHLEQAKAARDAALSEGAPMPSLPAGLATTAAPAVPGMATPAGHM